MNDNNGDLNGWMLSTIWSKAIERAIEKHKKCGFKYFSTLSFALAVSREYEKYRPLVVSVLDDLFLLLQAEAIHREGRSVVIQTKELKVANNYSVNEDFLKFKVVFKNKVSTLIKRVLKPKDLMLVWGGRRTYCNNERIVEVDCSSFSTVHVIVIPKNGLTKTRDNLRQRNELTVAEFGRPGVCQIIEISRKLTLAKAFDDIPLKLQRIAPCSKKKDVVNIQVQSNNNVSRTSKLNPNKSIDVVTEKDKGADETTINETQSENQLECEISVELFEDSIEIEDIHTNESITITEKNEEYVDPGAQQLRRSSSIENSQPILEFISEVESILDEDNMQNEGEKGDSLKSIIKSKESIGDVQRVCDKHSTSEPFQDTLLNSEEVGLNENQNSYATLLNDQSNKISKTITEPSQTQSDYSVLTLDKFLMSHEINISRSKSPECIHLEAEDNLLNINEIERVANSAIPSIPDTGTALSSELLLDNIREDDENFLFAKPTCSSRFNDMISQEVTTFVHIDNALQNPDKEVELFKLKDIVRFENDECNNGNTTIRTECTLSEGSNENLRTFAASQVLNVNSQSVLVYCDAYVSRVPEMDNGNEDVIGLAAPVSDSSGGENDKTPTTESQACLSLFNESSRDDQELKKNLMSQDLTSQYTSDSEKFQSMETGSLPNVASCAFVSSPPALSTPEDDIV